MIRYLMSHVHPALWLVCMIGPPGCTASQQTNEVGGEENSLHFQGEARVWAQVHTDTLGFQPRTADDGSIRLAPVCNVTRGGAFAVSAVSLVHNSTEVTCGVESAIDPCTEEGWIHVIPIGEASEEEIIAKASIVGGFWLRSEDVVLVAMDTAADEDARLSVEQARERIADMRLLGRFATPLGIRDPMLNFGWPPMFRLRADGKLVEVNRSGTGDQLMGVSPDSNMVWTVQSADGYMVARTQQYFERMCAASKQGCEMASPMALSVGEVVKGLVTGAVILVVLAMAARYAINAMFPRNATVRVQNTTLIEPATSLYAVTPISQAGQGGAPTAPPPSNAPPRTGLPPALFAEAMTCWSPDYAPCRFTLPPQENTWYCVCLYEGQIYTESSGDYDLNRDRDYNDQCGYLNFQAGSWEKACVVQEPGVAEGSPCEVTTTECAYPAFSP